MTPYRERESALIDDKGFSSGVELVKHRGASVYSVGAEMQFRQHGTKGMSCIDYRTAVASCFARP